MDRILLLVTVTIIATTAAKAQSVTYNHDSPKQNQVTVMETGTGALSPDLYYSILHNKYKKSAAVKTNCHSAHWRASTYTTKRTKLKPSTRHW